MAKLKGKLGCTLNLTIRYCTPGHRRSPTCQKINRKLWYCDVVTPQSCPRKGGKWTERICEEMNFLFWLFLKLWRRAHHDRFFPTFGIILARRQLFKVSNIRNRIHCRLILFVSMTSVSVVTLRVDSHVWRGWWALQAFLAKTHRGLSVIILTSTPGSRGTSSVSSAHVAAPLRGRA